MLWIGATDKVSPQRFQQSKYSEMVCVKSARPLPCSAHHLAEIIMSAISASSTVTDEGIFSHALM
jgi:hypothetical protein